MNFNSVHEKTMAICFLNTILQRNINAFQSFLKLKSQNLKLFVFVWLTNDKASVFIDSTDEQVVKYVRSLLELDKRKTYNVQPQIIKFFFKFLEKYLPHKHFLILNALDVPESQNEFVDYINYLFSNPTSSFVINDQVKVYSVN